MASAAWALLGDGGALRSHLGRKNRVAVIQLRYVCLAGKVAENPGLTKQLHQVIDDVVETVH
jgi:hypothetical protein